MDYFQALDWLSIKHKQLKWKSFIKLLDFITLQESTLSTLKEANDELHKLNSLYSKEVYNLNNRIMQLENQIMFEKANNLGKY